MHAIVFDVRINSLYSIRIPYTWQSALAYPLPPPSSIIGMVANALQRGNGGRHPLAWLDDVEANTVWAGAKLLSPCVIKGYTTSAITKWEVSFGGKATNALGRQFAYAKNLRMVLIVKDSSFAKSVVTALNVAPLTCGDSESPISLEGAVAIENGVKKPHLSEVRTEFPIRFGKKTVIRDGSGSIYLIHERCRKRGISFPLQTYLVPLREEEGILYPSDVLVDRPEASEVLEIEDLGHICFYPEHTR